MKRLSLAASTVLALSMSVSAQSGRTLTIHTAARLGGTLGILMQHPVGAAGNYYEALWSPVFPGAINIGLPFVHGLVRIDPNNYLMLYNGLLSAAGSTLQSYPIPSNVALLDVTFDLQTADTDGMQVYLADNDVTVRIIAGLCDVEIASGSTTSTTTGDMDLQSVNDATVGTPISRGLPAFSYQVIRHRGQEGFVEGYAGTFSATSHNSDIASLNPTRPARRLANAAYQTVTLPNGYDIAFVRDTANPKQFSVLSYNRITGVSRLVPGTTVTDTSTTAAPACNLLPYPAFSDDGQWCVVIVHDTNTTVPDRMLAFRTDASAPAINITATTTPSTAYFDGATYFTNDFIVASGSGGWYWTSANSPGPLQSLSIPNTAASDAQAIWVFPFSWRVSRDGSTAYFPAGSNASASRGEMDIYQLTNNGGLPVVNNFSRFEMPTGIAEFGYSAITPATTNNSSNGIKASVSPNGQMIAALAATTTTTDFPGIYLCRGNSNPSVITVNGAAFYSEVAFVNNNTVVFFAGPDNLNQRMYKFDLLTNSIGAISSATDIRTRGQFWSLNKNWCYFVRSNAASTKNDIVGIHASTARPRDVTGTEFSGGTAPSIRTGSFNTTADPWFALEMQLRLADDGFAYFTARRETGTAGVFEDANLFRFDIERGGQAEMLTGYTGTGAASAIINIESLMLSPDSKLVAWAQRTGTAATASEDVFYKLTGSGPIWQVSTTAPGGQSVTDGSIFFTCDPVTGVVWSMGTGSTSIPTTDSRVEWAPLGGPSIPLHLTPASAGPRVFQVLGTH